MRSRPRWSRWRRKAPGSRTSASSSREPAARWSMRPAMPMKASGRPGRCRGSSMTSRAAPSSSRASSARRKRSCASALRRCCRQASARRRNSPVVAKPLSHLILRSIAKRCVSKDEATVGLMVRDAASRLLTMRVANKRNDPMKAYVFGAGGAAITDVPKPAPKGTQVLVKVHACGLNRADIGMTRGHVHGSAGGVGTVLGMEWAGEVAELGAEAKGVKVGDRIMGSGGAAFAEYTLADHGRLFRAPSNMNVEEAATLPVALATMHNAVVTNGALKPGQSVMIQGASSGVGLMAMQIAKLKGASLVVGSSTDAYRRGRLKEFGADLAVDSSDPGWVDQVLKATNGEGVDLIVDQVSGKIASQNLAATKIKGRIVNVGRLGGSR